MKQKQRYLVITLAALMLAGCGLKGPLYMPTEEKSTTQQPVEQQTNTIEPTAQ